MHLKAGNRDCFADEKGREWPFGNPLCKSNWLILFKINRLLETALRGIERLGKDPHANGGDENKLRFFHWG